MLLLGGCAPSQTPWTGPREFMAEGRSPGIRLLLRPARRSTQTLPTSWSQATFTLASPAWLSGDRVQAVPIASFNPGPSPSTGVTLFPSSRPGGYTLFASLFNGAVRCAMGTTPVTLTAGSPTPATMTLRTLPTWTSGTWVSSSGTASFSGDGGAAVAATLNTPRGLAIAPDGTLYVADSLNQRIRRVAPGGSTISTIAGDGSTASFNVPRALAYDAAHDVLYVADSLNQRIRWIASASTAPTLASQTVPTSGHPLAIAFTAGASGSSEILFAAEDDHVVEQIANPRTAPLVTTVVGTPGTPGNTPGTANGLNVLLNYPEGLVVDGGGLTLYVADTGNRCIRQVALTTPGQPTSTLAGSGAAGTSGDGKLAASASFLVPCDLAYDATDGGRLYVLDTAAATVRVVTLANLLVATVFGNGTSAYQGDGGPAQQASLNAPSGMAFGHQLLAVSETASGGHRVRMGQ
jgi:hypothetical protein